MTEQRVGVSDRCRGSGIVGGDRAADVIPADGVCPVRTGAVERSGCADHASGQSEVDRVAESDVDPVDLAPPGIALLVLGVVGCSLNDRQVAPAGMGVVVSVLDGVVLVIDGVGDPRVSGATVRY